MKLSKNLKKLLISGIALVTLATTGSGIISAQNTANASSRTARITRLEHRRSLDYKDISSINHELSKLMPRRIRRHVHKHHESVATWYEHNSHRMYKKYINTSKMFRKGYDDSGADDSGLDSALNMEYTNNKMYHLGWIIGATSLDGDGSIKSYAHILNEYNQGIIFAHNNNIQNPSLDGDGNTWENDNN